MRDMTTGSPLRQIFTFFAPLLAGNLFQQLYNLADSVLVGRLLGVDAFAAVGSTGSLNFLVLGLALGCCSGFAIPIAQSFGAGDMAAVRRRTGQVVWLGLMVTAFITVLTFLFTDDILRLTNTPADIFRDAYVYIFIVFMGTGAIILYNLASSVLRAVGDSRTPLLFLVAAVVLNIALDILFMAPLGMGVEGAALATVISQALSGLACLAYIGRRVPLLCPTRSDLRPRWREMGRIAFIGVPMGLQFSITAVGSVILQSVTNSLGTAAVAAVSAGNKVQTIVLSPLESLGLTMATYCGQNLGAGKPERIRRGVRQITLLSAVYCLAALAFNYFAGEAVTQLFIEGSQTQVLHDSWVFLVINGTFYSLVAIILVFRNSLQGLGFSNEAMLAGVAELAARLAVATLLVPVLGYPGVCLAHPIAWAAADAVLLPLYLVKMGRLERQLQWAHYC